jgi:hypothetical protein
MPRDTRSVPSAEDDVGIDDLVGRAKGLAEKGKDLAGGLAEKGRDVAGDVTEKAKDVADKGKDVASGVAGKAKEVGATLAEEAREVKEIAAGEGTLSEKAKAAVDAVRDPGRPDHPDPPA